MEKIQQGKISPILSDKVQFLSVLYISIWAISPPLAYGTAYRLVAVVATLLWVLIELFKRPGTFLSPSPATFCVMVYVLYSGMVGYFVDGIDDTIRNIQTFIFLLFLVFFESYRRRDIRQLRFVFWTSMALFPLWLGMTLFMFGTHRNIARVLTRSSEVAQEFNEQGVGGFGLVYSIIVAVPILLYFIRNRASICTQQTGAFKKLLIITLILLNLVLGCVVIAYAGYSIAVILMVVSIVITLMVKSLTPAMFARLAGSALALILLFPLVSQPLADFAGIFLKGTMYERKVADILASIGEDDSVGTVSDRTDRYKRSISLFLENPLLGTLTIRDVGKHSAILDKFARFGIFIGAIFAFTVFYVPLRYLKKQSGKAYGMTLGVAFTVIGFTFLNNAFASLGFMVFLFYPIAMSYVDDMELHRNQ